MMNWELETQEIKERVQQNVHFQYRKREEEKREERGEKRGRE